MSPRRPQRLEVATEGGIGFNKPRLVLGGEVDKDAERYVLTMSCKADPIRQRDPEHCHAASPPSQTEVVISVLRVR